MKTQDFYTFLAVCLFSLASITIALVLGAKILIAKRKERKEDKELFI